MGRKPKKRVNGEGSVYKRKDSRWVGQYVDHTAVPPKYRYVYAKTQAEALRKRNEAMSKLGSGLAFDAGVTTLGEFLDRWIEDSIKDSVSPSRTRTTRCSPTATSSRPSDATSSRTWPRTASGGSRAPS